MARELWEFWIDVGGTFTDCIAQPPAGDTTPDGTTRRLKLLSSGVTKGAASPESNRRVIVDPLRAGDPDDFWTGFQLQLLTDNGQSVASARVERFVQEAGELHLADSLPFDVIAGARYELAARWPSPVLAVRYFLGLRPDDMPPPVRLRLGTTRGTNALLTRTGARTALITTKGFGDILAIGYQTRPRLFDLTVCKPPPLYHSVVEVDERLVADGHVLTSLDEASVRQQLSVLRDDGVESIAICLLHADLFPQHEQTVERIARDVGFSEVSRSSRVAPIVKIVSRGDTTVVDAYLNPVLRSYVAQLTAQLPGSEIRLMTSAGGLATPEAFYGFQSVLSGPAGGVVGFARAAKTVGFDRAIGFDMGGTSTDVSRYDGAFDYEYETTKAGVRLSAPTLAINTVAAGGGSICRFDGVKLVVGPESAGADPGPACYGRGGPLCVTDLNLYLGRLVDEHFPFRLDREAVQRRLDALAAEVQQATDETIEPPALAEGLLRIANANMARAIHSVTIGKGYDPREYALVAFGGAAGQHACAVADELGVHRILIHPDAGILSALGIGAADMSLHAAKGLYQLLQCMDQAQLAHTIDELARPLVEQLVAAGNLRERIEVRSTLDLRYVGVDEPINVPLDDRHDPRTQFETAHRRQYGYLHDDREIEATVVRVEVIGKVDRQSSHSEHAPRSTPRPAALVRARFAGREIKVPLFRREEMTPGARLVGPAIVVEPHSSIVVEPSWNAAMLTGRELMLSRDEPATSAPALVTTSDAVLLEVFNNLLVGVAERMGHVLRRTAGSVNVKERLDFSCAVFTADGDLVANAPHVPVHLGAMGETVRSVLGENPNLQGGDVVVTNDPYRGGSHLPDITAIMPVHVEDGERAFIVACRAHHAEIGGVRPGSMPPNSRRLGEEGVVISNFMLVCDGVARFDELAALLTEDEFPTRALDDNLADLRAQVASLQQGVADLQQLVRQYGLEQVTRQTIAVQQAAETKVRAALARLEPGEREFEDWIELADGDSAVIRVRITVAADPVSDACAVRFDFTGASPVVSGNLNANSAIVRAAVLYVLRLLVDEDIPLNEGALRPVEVILPDCFLNPPPADSLRDSPAVAAGNVETSQRIVDVLLGALGLAAASQGTMNNVLFGDATFGCYETICGGAGATPDGPGSDAVQVHMTNTAATDPEVLERRHPVRLREFSVRRSSGGAGQHCGGNGAIRHLEFLAPLELSIISQRRGQHPPYGAAGGQPGALGENLLIRADGTVEQLPGICQRQVGPGDQLIVRTPGGGGWGEPAT